MIRARPFKLLNATERARVEDLAAVALDAWRRDWTLAPIAAGGVSCEPAIERNDLSVISDWLSFTADGATLYLARSDRAPDLMQSAIANGATEAGARANTIVSNLAQTALQALIDRLIAAPADRSSSSPPRELWLRGSGAACVTLPLAHGTLTALFDAALIAKMVAPVRRPAKRRPALAHPQSCIGAQPVEIRVWLGHADIEFDVLRTLATNDVILLESRIDHPLRVSVAGAEAAPRAVLGYAGEKKAVRLATYADER